MNWVAARSWLVHVCSAGECECSLALKRVGSSTPVSVFRGAAPASYPLGLHVVRRAGMVPIVGAAGGVCAPAAWTACQSGERGETPGSPWARLSAYRTRLSLKRSRYTVSSGFHEPYWRHHCSRNSRSVDAP